MTETIKGLCLNGNNECPEKYLQSVINVYIIIYPFPLFLVENLHSKLKRLTQILLNNGYANSGINVALNVNKWYNQAKDYISKNIKLS